MTENLWGQPQYPPDPYRNVPPAPEPLKHTSNGTAGALTTEQIDERFPTLDWTALWATEIDTDDEWIIPFIVGRRRGIAVFSRPKAGKSLLALEWCGAVATGRDLFGEPVRQRHVLYVDFENDPVGDILPRLQDMGYEPDELVEHLHYLTFPNLDALDTAAGGRQLLAVALRWHVELIVIDTLSRVVAGEENSNDTYLAFYRQSVMPCKRAGIAVLRLDHSGKDAEKGMRGGSAKTGDVDAIWRLDADSGRLILTCTDSRMVVEEKILTLTRWTDPLRHTLETGFGASVEAKTGALVDTLDRLEVPNSAGERIARVYLKPANIKARNDVLRKACARRQQRLVLPFDEQ